MSQTTAPATPLDHPDRTEPLVRHSRRPRWGRALPLWERDDKRGYLFEDGSMRVFGVRFCSLLRPEKVPNPTLRLKLRADAIAAGHLGDGRRATGDDELAPTIDDQITVFSALYPDAFDGDAWQQRYRARASGRRIKRLRDAAIMDAATRLSKAALSRPLQRHEAGVVARAVVDVLRTTDLVSPAQLAVLGGLSADLRVDRALFDLLHGSTGGEVDALSRLRAAIERHGVKRPSWPLVTAARALLHPDDHVFVRHTIVRKQARWLMPRHAPGAVPTDREYRRALAVAAAVRQRLVLGGIVPRDLFDVSMFMRVTLSRAADIALRSATARRLAGRVYHES
jgi:hypothetical protein